MSEPATTAAASGTSLVAIAAAVVGQAAGEYLAIVLCALAGSLWALQGVPTESRTAAAALVVRLVLTAVALTSAVSWLLSTYYDAPGHHVLAAVSFAIGLGPEGWRGLIGAARAALLKRTGGAP